MSDTEQNAATPWEELVEVGQYPTLELAYEYGLVILAMRQPCWVAQDDNPPGGFSLHAEAHAAPAVARELLAYQNEQAAPIPRFAPEPDVFRHPPGWGVYGIWMGTLVLTFLWQAEDPSLVGRAASSSIGLIACGEWWRPFTALFLHADLGHLTGNLLSGLFFGSLVARSIGPLRAWALILACGTAGNALTSALAYPDPFVSLGASTAVFGALGILSGLGVASLLRAPLRLPWARLAAPLLAGIILLGWLGGGGHDGNTDVLGHICGFTTGLTAGFIIGRFTSQ